MNRRILLLATLALPLTAIAQTPSRLTTSGLKDPPLSMLKSQLGVTEDQAKGGVALCTCCSRRKNSPRATSTKSPSLVPGASNVHGLRQEARRRHRPTEKRRRPERRTLQTRHEIRNRLEVRPNGHELPSARQAETASSRCWRAF